MYGIRFFLLLVLVASKLLAQTSVVPTWKRTWFDFGKIPAGERFQYRLPPYVRFPPSGLAHIRIEKLPPWMKWDSKKGTLHGTPTAKHQGKFKGVLLKLSPSGGGEVTSVAQGFGEVIVTGLRPTPSVTKRLDSRRIRSVNTSAAKVQVDPLYLPKATLGNAFTFDLATNVQNPKPGLTFKFLKMPPKWLHLSADGKLSGIPDQMGDFACIVEISDGDSAIQNGVLGTVLDSADPPVIHSDRLIFSLKENETKTLSLNDPQYVSAGGANPLLVFKLLVPSSWASLAPNGTLRLSPLYPQVGPQKLPFEVRRGSVSAMGEIRITVSPDPQVPQWKQKAYVFNGSVDAPFKQTLGDQAWDKNGRPLTFSKHSGPSWLGITPQGDLVGTPGEDAVGDQNFVIRASNESLSADASLVIKVVQGNRPPRWLNKRLGLPMGRVGEKYRAPLTSLVKDPDGDAIRFALVSGTRWTQITPDGTVIGTPRPGDDGTASIRVKATDASGASSEVTLSFTVLKAKLGPRWVGRQPLSLGNIQVGKPFFFDLTPLVKDDDGDSITFTLINGPTWLKVDSKGQLSAEASADAPLGNFVAVIQASDGTIASQAGFSGQLIPRNKPPVIQAAALQFTVEERRTIPIQLNQTGLVSDPDKDPLSFSLKPVSWASLSTDGQLILRPTFAQIGTQTLTFQVTDTKDVITGQIHVEVQRDPRPPRWKSGDGIRLTATAGVPFAGSLQDQAEDLDGLPLTFSSTSGPKWLKVAADGSLSGTPEDPDAGENTFIVSVRNDKLSASQGLVILVQSDNSPPTWAKNPVVLGTPAKAGVTYWQSLKEYAIDPDPGDTLTFEVIVGSNGKPLAPRWLNVTSNGLLIGVPSESDVGLNIVQVRVRDSRQASADTKVQIQVDSKNSPPQWLQTPIALGSTVVGKSLNFDLAPLAKDPDGDALHFHKASGPAWLRVADNGQITGTPGATDATSFTATFEVSDGKATASTEAFGSVGAANKPPVIFDQALKFVVATDQPTDIELNQKGKVEDPEGGSLVFALLSAEPWVKLSPGGKLTVAPKPENKGTYKIAFRVTDKEGASAEGIVQLDVNAAVKPPVWLLDSIELTATADVPFEGDLSKYARDWNDLPLSFQKDSGPDWLTVNSTGKIEGHPSASESQEVQKFQVSASNGSQKTPIALWITVKTANKQVHTLDQPGERAAVDLVFVVSHTPRDDAFYDSLKRGASDFFSALDQAQLQYSAAVLSARSTMGDLIADSQGSTILTAADQPSYEFGRALDVARTSNKIYSPIWALDQFFLKLSPGSSSQQSFYRPEVPVFILIQASESDEFDAMATGSDLTEGASIEDVTRSFVQFHAKLNKPVQIYVNDMTCDASAGRVYQQLAAGTNGKIFKTLPCQPPFTDAMTSFASAVIQEAGRSASVTSR